MTRREGFYTLGRRIENHVRLRLNDLEIQLLKWASRGARRASLVPLSDLSQSAAGMPIYYLLRHTPSTRIF